MKMPEMKYSGNITACTIGCAASSVLIALVNAKPRQTNATAPMTAVTTTPTSVLLGSVTP